MDSHDKISSELRDVVAMTTELLKACCSKTEHDIPAMRKLIINIKLLNRQLSALASQL